MHQPIEDMKPAQVAARKGALFLDEKMSGWAKRIKLDYLDQSSPTRCVIGQLFTDEDDEQEVWFSGSFTKGCKELGIYCEFAFFTFSKEERQNGYAKIIELGFEGAFVLPEGMTRLDYFKDLTAAWKEEITARL